MEPKRLMSLILFMNLMAIYGTNSVLQILGINGEQNARSEVENFANASFVPSNNNNSIQYLLYTPEQPEEVCYFEPNDANECVFNVTYETKILVHGYTVQLLPGNYFEQIKNKLLKYNSYNVIIVNWTNYNGPSYLLAKAEAYLVGINIGTMINFLVSNKGMNPSNVHIIGHSLGAHVAGVAGKQVPNLGRVTGLDPAGPFFTTFIEFNRLSFTSAKLVDVMHTSNYLTGVGLGMGDAIGSIDFYPNGGNEQPACQMGNEFRNADAQVNIVTSLLTMASCYHNIALPYFMNSIHECKYLSVECENYKLYSEENCDSDTNAINRMGLYCVEIPGLPSESKFYLNTTANPPYCENE
ncbi:Pancreatic triacylglycerol lipase-like protein [Argiope bruennichi]|uniref:Pancreatic triacylglycerol lipase-like protein n=1 Tax=Argiope bruennichi TaxID=94029 RepID=A0A8T0FQ24_ARGBR|nr:Pancreatic triacylglycerol lipase-like protein [Argiope bruennichi]